MPGMGVSSLLMQVNDPTLWRSVLPHPAKDGHKYDRGHLVVLGGTDMTGAARLASEAAMRMGCGVCTIVSDPSVKDIYLKGAPHVMFEAYKALSEFPSHLQDDRRTAFIAGSGAGQRDPQGLRQAVLGALKTQKPAVLDADALSVFKDDPALLFDSLHARCVLTPHEGEFARLFPDLAGPREERAVAAATLSGAVVVLKGAETLIAASDGQLIINRHASEWLATAGSGDVLAGMLGGLQAQGVDCFMGSAAAVWMHGEIAIRFGAGLTAPDIISGIPEALRVFA